MIALRHILWKAASLAASNPRVQRRATKIYKAQVEPRAKEAWNTAKPKLDEKRAKLGNIARETDPVRHPLAFAAKAGKTLRGKRPPE